MRARGRPFSVCVFCGSRFGEDPGHATLARDFGTAVARRGWRLVYGGGEVGLMGEVAGAAIGAGGEVLGIIPRRLLEREVGKRDLSELVVTETMSERKERMIEASDAFVALPGGLGTLDELLEVMTLRQLGYIDTPILVLTTAFWAPFTALVEATITTGFAHTVTPSLVEAASDLDAALGRLDEAASAR